jgi:hypothetical protein
MLRRILPADIPIISEWISKDEDRARRSMTAEFFTCNLCFAIADIHGPIMYVRIDPEPDATARIHIQFDSQQKLRTARALAHEFPLVQDRIKSAGVKHIIFDSVSESLIRFCQKRFGFVRVADSNDYIKEL